MESKDLWHGTIGVLIVCCCIGIVGIIAFLLFVPHGPIRIVDIDVRAATTSAHVKESQEAPSAHVSAPNAFDTAAGALFTCAGGGAIKAVFSGSHVSLTLSDGRSIILPRSISAAMPTNGGVSYANTDESFVFWNTDTTAFIEENGLVTYSNCSTE